MTRDFLLIGAASVATIAVMALADRAFSATIDPDLGPLPGQPEFSVEDVIEAFPEYARAGRSLRPAARPCEPLPGCLRDVPVVTVTSTGEKYLGGLPYAGRDWYVPGNSGGHDGWYVPGNSGGHDGWYVPNTPDVAPVSLPESWGLLAGVMSLFALCGIWRHCDDLEEIR